MTRIVIHVRETAGNSQERRSRGKLGRILPGDPPSTSTLSGRPRRCARSDEIAAEDVFSLQRTVLVACKMNSLLKTVNSIAGNKRHLLIRDSLQKHLNTSVMEMQSAPGAAEDGVVGNCDETMSLCSVLEAIFLHGLKDSLLNRVTEALSGPDFDAMPQPSFWGPLLVFSHRQIIDQIQALSQVSTEVGYCRAWIRLALNEGLLASYFCSIRRDNSALKPYYNRTAYIRDMDLVEVAQRLIENLDYVRFELACNSSLLNFWSTTPLLLAGIWSPPMKSCPVFSAVDIAKTITSDLTYNDNFDEDIETASSIGSSIGIGSFNSSQSMFNNVSITEDEALKIILANERSDKTTQQSHNDFTEASASSSTQESNITQQSHNKPADNVKRDQRKDKREVRKVQQVSNGNVEKKDDNTHTEDPPTLQNAARDSEAVNDTTAAVGNSLIGKLGWSTSFEDCQSSLTSSVISHGSGADARTPGDGATYDALILSYQTAGNSSVPDLQEFLKKYPTRETIEEGSKAQSEPKV